jgi:hypothetical protein
MHNHLRYIDGMKRKNPFAVMIGRKGGKAGRGWKKARSPQQARYAARCRWDKEYRKLFVESK